MRSVAGCLTCRRRKLKCDEQKPSCGQCRKARRECRPSQIVFRHLQDSLRERYGSGKEPATSVIHSADTRQRGSIQVHQPTSTERSSRWLDDETERTDGSVGLEDCPSHSSLLTPPIPHHRPFDPLNESSRFLIEQNSNVLNAVPLQNASDFIATVDQNEKQSYDSRSTPPPNNFLDSILNPSETMEPCETPNAFGQLPPESLAETSILSEFATSPPLEPPPETGGQVAFLLRHFSEGPGKWMDLYDAGLYFSVDVPIQSLSSPLLKSAVCAYSAKHISRLDMKSKLDQSTSRPSTSTWPEAEQFDWAVLGAQYYTKAINLLREQLNEPDELNGSAEINSSESASPESHISRRSSDELLGITAILCAYEHLSASDLAWSGHLSGTMALLNIATHELRPYSLSPGPYDNPGPSKARKAIFWNFARQDFLAAFINRSKTRIDTEDYRIWRDAGLPLDSRGNLDLDELAAYRCGSNDSYMKDYILSKSMIWLLAKVNNLISASLSFSSWKKDRHTHFASEEFNAAQSSQQAALKDQWACLSHQLDTWSKGLTPHFRPCARVDSSEYSFPEIWYSNEMCGSTIQQYHLARILLLLHNPYAPTADDSTVTRFLDFYRTTEADITRHCHEICGIALSHKSCSMYLHQCQTLYVMGQCLSSSNDRQLVVDLLRRMRAETGWETEYRVQQLFAEWGWETN